MADAKLSGLDPITGSVVALTDLMYLVDISEVEAGSKRITIQEFINAIEGLLVVQITRTPSDTESLTVDTVGNIATCTALDMSQYSGGVVHVPSGSSVTTLTPYVNDSGTSTGTYVPFYDVSGGSTAIAVAASKSYEMPIALFACKWVKFVANDSGTIKVDLKA